MTEDLFEPVQPIHQGTVWKQVGADVTPERVAKAIEDAKRSDPRFMMEGGSWTNDISWVRGYENVLDPIKKLSARFHETLGGRAVEKRGQAYRNALFHLLTAESSDFRYWGQGRWTDYAREICRRGEDILRYDFAQPVRA